MMHKFYFSQVLTSGLDKKNLICVVRESAYHKTCVLIHCEIGRLRMIHEIHSNTMEQLHLAK